MYNYAQQTPGQYYQMPERQDVIYPDYPETYRPLVPRYPSNGTQPTPMYPTTPMYPGYQQPVPYVSPAPIGTQPILAPDVGFEEGPPTLTDIGYTPAYLKTQIGRRVKVEFLLGTNMLVDREGTLLNVGINYIIIQEVDTDDLLLCDLYSIKFVKFYY
ncbi:MAG: hypothetical protein AB7G87_14025 [Clostridia bacterium]